jgi:type I restriction enzyme, S subunit
MRNKEAAAINNEQDQDRELEPKLRFPEFRDAEKWKKENLGSVAEFVNEKIPVEQLTVANYVSTENLLPNYEGLTKASKLPSSGSVTRFKVNDILVSNIRPYLRKVWSSNMEGGASNDVLIIRAGERVLPQYLSSALKDETFIDYVMQGAKGVKMPRGDISLIREYPLPYPSQEEQLRIADCLSSIDELITGEARKLGAFNRHKNGLIQQLFPADDETIPCMRFSEFRSEGEWAARELGEFITERDQSPEENVPLFSLTIEDGVTPKTERYERSFLVKDEKDAYKVMLPSDFAYNPMNLRFGAIGRHSGKDNVAVSKYYNIFCCDRTVDSRFCEIYFKSDRMIAFYDNMAAGSLIEKRRVHFNDFLKFSVRFPSLPEQQRIADCLSFLDELIDAQCLKVDALKAHKIGLMQLLFPIMDEVGG